MLSKFCLCKLVLPFTIVVLLVAACTTVVPVLPTATVEATSTHIATLPPTVTITPTVTTTPTPTPTVTPTFTPQPTPMGGGMPVFAFNGSTKDQYRPYLVNLDQGDPLVIEAGWNKFGFNYPQWSHNRRYIAIANDDGIGTWSLYVYDCTTGGAQKLVTGEPNFAISQMEWSSDDQWIAFAYSYSRGGSAYFNYHTISLTDKKVYKIDDGIYKLKWRQNRNEVVYMARDSSAWWSNDAFGKKKAVIAFEKIIPAGNYNQQLDYIVGFFTELDGFILSKRAPKSNDYEKLMFFPFEKGSSWMISHLTYDIPQVKLFNDGQWLYLNHRDKGKSIHELVNLSNQQVYPIPSSIENGPAAFEDVLGVSPDGRMVVYTNRVKQGGTNQIAFQEIATGRLVRTWEVPKSILPSRIGPFSDSIYWIFYTGTLEWLPLGK